MNWVSCGALLGGIVFEDRSYSTCELNLAPLCTRLARWYNFYPLFEIETDVIPQPNSIRIPLTEVTCENIYLEVSSTI